MTPGIQVTRGRQDGRVMKDARASTQTDEQNFGVPRFRSEECSDIHRHGMGKHRNIKSAKITTNTPPGHALCKPASWVVNRDVD